jgi:hypothetical protein
LRLKWHDERIRPAAILRLVSDTHVHP